MAMTDFVVDKENLEVRITRVFECTPERLWKAHTDPEEVVQWWSDVKVDKFEPVVGGKWRLVGGKNQSGQDNAFRGEFKEIDKPHKIVRTFEYEPMPGHVMTESVIFEAIGDNQTRQTTISKFANLDDLNGMVGMGMEHGATAGLDRLAQVVENS